MRRFRFAGDPLCVGSCGLYAVNRWLLKPLVHIAFLHSYFNDLLLIPAALPLALWLQKRLSLREGDDYPTNSEILFHLAVWSVVCEMAGPRLVSWATGDYKDVFAYSAGALFAALWWSRAGSKAGGKRISRNPT